MKKIILILLISSNCYCQTCICTLNNILSNGAISESSFQLVDNFLSATHSNLVGTDYIKLYQNGANSHASLYLYNDAGSGYVKFSDNNTNGYLNSLKTESISTDRTVSLPDQDGTLLCRDSKFPLTVDNSTCSKSIIDQSGISVTDGISNIYAFFGLDACTIPSIIIMDATLNYYASILANTQNSNINIIIPKTSGTLALDFHGTYSTSATATLTYSIPHGLSFTPTFATVVPTSPEASKNFYISGYDPTNIYITFTFAPIPTSTLSWTWIAYP